MNLFNNNFLYIEGLDKNEELIIDKSKQDENIVFTTKDGFVLHPCDIYLYGELDLNNEEDINLIKSKDLLSDDVWSNSILFSDMTDDGVVTSNEEGIFKKYPTWDRLKWFMYNYILIGKPKRIIIFKVTKSQINRINGTRF